MEQQNAKFRFVGYKVLKSLIEIQESIKASDDMSIEFKQSQGVNVEDSKFRLVLEVNIFDENKAININVIAHGYFEFDRELNEADKGDFFNINAPAILFPYLRAYVNTLTALSGIPSVTLPTVNLSGGAVQE